MRDREGGMALGDDETKFESDKGGDEEEEEQEEVGRFW